MIVAKVRATVCPENITSWHVNSERQKTKGMFVKASKKIFSGKETFGLQVLSGFGSTVTTTMMARSAHSKPQIIKLRFRIVQRIDNGPGKTMKRMNTMAGRPAAKMSTIAVFGTAGRRRNPRSHRTTDSLSAGFGTQRA